MVRVALVVALALTLAPPPPHPVASMRHATVEEVYWEDGERCLDAQCAPSAAVGGMLAGVVCDDDGVCACCWHHCRGRSPGARWLQRRYRKSLLELLRRCPPRPPHLLRPPRPPFPLSGAQMVWSCVRTCVCVCVWRGWAEKVKSPCTYTHTHTHTHIHTHIHTHGSCCKAPSHIPGKQRR